MANKELEQGKRRYPQESSNNHQNKLLLMGGTGLAIASMFFSPADKSIKTENCTLYTTNVAEKLSAKEMPTIVAIGDSLTAYERGWTHKLRCDYLLKSQEIPQIDIFAKPGWTTHQVLLEFVNNPSLSTSIKEADAIVLEIGLNDIGYAKILHEKGQKCLPGEPEEGCLELITNDIYHENISRILTNIRNINSTSPIIIPELYYMRIANEKKENKFETYNKYLKSMVTYIRSLDGENGVHIARIYEDINGVSGTEAGQERGYLISDGHPNDKGSSLIASRIYELLN